MRPADATPPEAGTDAARAVPRVSCGACQGRAVIVTPDGETECPGCDGAGEVPPNEREDDDT